MVVSVVVILAARSSLPSRAWSSGRGSRRVGGGLMRLQGGSQVGLHGALAPTHSVVERFGLFTIIVLGEVVFGVVDGLSEAERDVQDDLDGDDRAVVGFGLLVDLLRHRRPAAAAA